MSTFTIDAGNTITAYPSVQEASQGGAGLPQFDSQNELAKVTAQWPLTRLVEIWNHIPGSTQIHKFQNRQTAIARIWKALPTLAANSPATQRERRSESATAGAPAKSRKAGRKKKGTPKSTRDAKRSHAPSSGRTNKKAQVIALMQRAKGVTLGEVMATTGWQRHTVRGFVSILGSKGGHAIESSQNAGGERTYRIPK